MRFSDEARCHICKRIFCCGKCRQKHQLNTHAIAVTRPVAVEQADMNTQMQANEGIVGKTTTIYVFCPICEHRPLPLREEMYAELLVHIEQVHLPLRCHKCLRQYTKVEDLREFSKCVDLTQNCSSASTEQNQSCDTNASKVTVKKANVAAASTISTQTSPSIAKDLQQQQHLTPISLFNLRWKAKGRHTQEEFISDSVSSIRNVSVDNSNFSVQQRLSIGLASATDTSGHIKGKVIRSTSTPLQVCTMFAKPKETLAFNASAGSSGAHLSSIYHSGYIPDEQHTPALAPDSSHLLQTQQRPWKVPGRGKISAVTPLRQVMSKSIQKAFVEHGVGRLTGQGEQRRLPLDLNESPDAGRALDLRLSPAVRRTQYSIALDNNETNSRPKPYQIMLSAQKLTTESIIITRSSGGSFLPASTSGTSTTSTVYNSCESLEIITSSTAVATAKVSASVQQESVAVPPLTPITRIPGAAIGKKLIKFETPQKHPSPESSQADESAQDDKDVFYTPNPSSSPIHAVANKEPRNPQFVPRQLSGDFSPDKKRAPLLRPQGPRARPPLRTCRTQKTFSCVQDIGSDDEDDYEDEVFRPTSASTHNDKRSKVKVAQPEPGRLWSLMSTVMRLPVTLRADRAASSGDKEKASTASSSSSSLIRRCASFAGSFVRNVSSPDDADMQSLKRKRTQTLDNQYYNQFSPSSSSKRFRIQPRQPIERMRKT